MRINFEEEIRCYLCGRTPKEAREYEKNGGVKCSHKLNAQILDLTKSPTCVGLFYDPDNSLQKPVVTKEEEGRGTYEQTDKHGRRTFFKPVTEGNWMVSLFRFTHDNDVCG